LLSAVAASLLGERIAGKVLFMLRRLGTGCVEFLGRSKELCNPAGIEVLRGNRKCIGSMESLENFTA